MGSILFLLELCVCFYDCRGHVLEHQPSLILVSNQELSACPVGAWIGIVSMVSLPHPWLFCLGLCRGKLSEQNPFEIRIF